MCLLMVLVGLASPQEEVGEESVHRLEGFPTPCELPSPGGHTQNIWGLSS